MKTTDANIALCIHYALTHDLESTLDALMDLQTVLNVARATVASWSRGDDIARLSQHLKELRTAVEEKKP